MRVVGYARVSTEKQRDEATIDTQVQLIEHKCAQEGYELLRIYRDNGVSGESTYLHERPEGSLLLEAAKSGEFEAVIVYHPDRLGRKQLVSETVVDQLYDRLGIKILDTTGSTDLTTDMGRMMFTMNSAIASVERSRILKRSMDATIRHAENGVWLGGVAPYGYRCEGKKKDARLRLATEKIAGLDISEVEVVEMIYRWAAKDKLSCFKIADRLQAMGVPTSYARDEREVLTNKRKQKTANLWRAGRIRNMLVETYYKGEHEWGKRQKKQRVNEAPRPTIKRVVPAIVDEQTWESAQETLVHNRMISLRNSKREYLLRGKMKCGLCNLTYGGSVSRGAKADTVSANHHPSYEIKDGYILRPYYCCTGKNNHRGIYGQKGERCPSRMISSQIVEAAVWADIEDFLRNPGDVLAEIQSQLMQGDSGMEQLRKDHLHVKRLLERQDAEKGKVLELYRKEIINEATLVSELKVVEKNGVDLKAQLERVESEMEKINNQQNQCQTTQQLLLRLNIILNSELTFEVKREIVDALVDWIRVDTITDGKKKSATIKVFYRFESSTGNSGPLNSGPVTLTETGEDVPADSCSTAGKPSPNPAPAPRPRLEGIFRAFRVPYSTGSTSTSRCPDSPRRS